MLAYHADKCAVRYMRHTAKLLEKIKLNQYYFYTNSTYALSEGTWCLDGVSAASLVVQVYATDKCAVRYMRPTVLGYTTWQTRSVRDPNPGLTRHVPCYRATMSTIGKVLEWQNAIEAAEEVSYHSARVCFFFNQRNHILLKRLTCSFLVLMVTYFYLYVMS